MACYPVPVPQVSKSIRFAIIGPGRAAARFAHGLQAVENTSLAAIWGRNSDRARAFAGKFSDPIVAPTLNDLLSSNIDAVYIATHPDTHAEFCLQALAAGIHVLCEKPAALNVCQLQTVLSAARRHDRLFMEAMKPPFFPLYQRLRRHLESDPIGLIGFVRAGHCDSSIGPDYPLHFAELGGGGIMGIGPYEAFLALDWLGPLKRVQTMGRLNSEGVDNFAIFQTEHERGLAQLHTGIDLLSHGDALLSGPGGYVLLRANWWNPSYATVHYLDGRIVEIDSPYTGSGFNYETTHFCDLIRQDLRESPVIPHALSLGMARLLEEARVALGVHFPAETKIDDRHPFDKATGLDTGGFIPGNDLHPGHPHDSHLGSYYGTAPSLVQAVLDRWLETPDRLFVENYTFIDFGSGKGRVVLIASKLPFRKCIGVELNPDLNAIAADNFARWQQSGNPRSPLEAVCQDALAFEFPPGPCLVYLFNPFPSQVLAHLIDRIAEAFAGRPGQLDLLYVNAEFKDLLDQHQGFTPLWQMPVTMSAEDAAADLLHQVDASGRKPYAEDSQDPCVAWRFTGSTNVTPA
ncbi:MAG TPA: Gfo/Idh/MocA family oxidoreductase [Terracidiphilus sp.]|nr:Gfo/Idh/MocA family oxidoreductase [Terracidiphilus sp.]